MLDYLGLEFPSQIRWVSGARWIVLAHSTKEWNGDLFLQDGIEILNELDQEDDGQSEGENQKGEKWDIKAGKTVRRVIEAVKAGRGSALNWFNFDVFRSPFALEDFITLCQDDPRVVISIGGRANRWYNENSIQEVINQTGTYPGLMTVAAHFDGCLKKAYLEYLKSMVKESHLLLTLWRGKGERRVSVEDKRWMVEYTDPATTFYDLM